jgi:6-phosphogluconolactonase (cycloisomerase 2 family)
MKLKNFGRATLALAASAVIVLGMTSCSLSYTVGYLFVTGAQYNQIASYRIQNDNGALHQTSIVGTDANPTQAVVTASGNYVYVLTGTGTDANPQPSKIQLFSIGGYGSLTFQTSFSPQGFNTRNIVISGNYLYALDEFAPGGSGPGGTQPYGDITAFAIDSGTGRLTPIPNQQSNNNGSTYFFPVGTNPTWLAMSGAYAFVAEQGPVGSTNPNDPPQAIFLYNVNATNGQLTLTQSTPTPTGATQLTYIYATSQYVYALDAGPAGSTGFILPFTPTSGGTLSAVSGGARANNGQGQAPVFPSRILKESTNPFLWVTSQDVNTNVGASASTVTAYVISSGSGTAGQLFDANFGGTGITAGVGTRCLVEDPSNQYIYLANFNDSTISGKKIDQKSGFLSKLPIGMPAPPGSPTWCATTGAHF